VTFPNTGPGERLRDVAADKCGGRSKKRAEAATPRPFLMRLASILGQVQTILVVSKSADISPLAFTVKCAWKSNNTLDPSDPRATT
jgi:hypothetical protein